MKSTLVSLAIVSLAVCAHPLYALRVIHNKTDIPLYAAGYHTTSDNKAIRQTKVIEIPAHEKAGVDVPLLRSFSKQRYIAINREKGELSENETLNSIRAMPHINITSQLSKLEGDYYIVDKEGRLQIYTSIEYSKFGKFVKATAQDVKKDLTEFIIDKEALPTIRDNSYRSQVAQVRSGKEISPQEQNYLTQRKPKVQHALRSLLPNATATSSRAPVISVVLSGGGDRAMFTSCGFVQGLQETGILDVTTYVAALSGSSWFLGSWYASGIPQVAACRKKLAQTMTRGILAVSPREFSRMIDALQVKYVYHQPITKIDLYGAFLGNALLKEYGDKCYQIYLSDQKNNVVAGDWPFPIYTAIDGSKITHTFERWYEFTPYEVGADWLNFYIPTWAFGRRFAQGTSVDDAPEVPLAFLFGIFGSAIAVDASRAWEKLELFISLSESTKTFVQKHVLNQLGHKRLTQGEEFNFTAGMPKSLLRDEKYMILVDGGLGTNLPYPVVSGEREERAPDVLIFFDASMFIGDIKKSVDAAAAEFLKSEAYARAHGLKFPQITTVLPQMINIYKDENDPSVPVVIWMPCMFEANRYATLALHDNRFTTIKDFDFSSCVKSFCATTNFTYSVAQAEQLITLGQFCAHACQHEIIEAIAWKLEHMKP